MYLRYIAVSQKPQKAQMVDLNTRLGFGISLEKFNWAETRILLCFHFKPSFNL